MVTFDLDPETQRIVNEVAQFVDEEVAPLEEKVRPILDHESRMIQEDGTLHPELQEATRRVRRMSAERGFYAMHLPEEAGGRGVGAVGMLRAFKEVYRRGAGLNFGVLPSIEGPTRMLLALTPEQRKTYLDPLVRGEKTTCFALTEPDVGSDVRNLQATARLEGDEWVLNGVKKFITYGPYADFASVFAKVEGTEDDGFGALTVFLVDRDAPGLRIGPVNETIANNGLPCELHMEDCRIPRENVLGEPGEGFYHALRSINDTRIQIGGMAIGLSQYCLDRTLDYVREREAFGRPISKFQGVSFPLADRATELKAAEMLATYTAWKIDQGEDPILETSMVKLYTTETLWNLADTCVQVQGAHGTLRETRIERILRWARVMRIFEGANEIQRQTIAKCLGL